MTVGTPPIRCFAGAAGRGRTGLGWSLPYHESIQNGVLRGMQQESEGPRREAEQEDGESDRSRLQHQDGEAPQYPGM